MKVVCIANIPAPYRERVYELFSATSDIDFQVWYCAGSEANRDWKIKPGEYVSDYLSSTGVTLAGRQIYLSSDISDKLSMFQPDVVIIGGFSWPMLRAFFWARIHKKAIIAITDAHLESEKHLSKLHVFLRKWVYSRCKAGLGASRKSMALLEHYGIASHRTFQSHLCCDNSKFHQENRPFIQREFDVVLCGRICKEKKVDFALDVLIRAREAKANLRVLVVGDGPLRHWFLDELKQAEISHEYAGFVTQERLPELYPQAKVMMFPSIRDAWGVVANEACAAGTVVITCPEVGAAGELVIDEENGYVLPLDNDLWARRLLELLKNQELWSSFSARAVRSVKTYTYQNAAEGILNAVKKAVEG